jgi:flagellar biogenesis protein FliO
VVVAVKSGEVEEKYTSLVAAISVVHVVVAKERLVVAKTDEMIGALEVEADACVTKDRSVLVAVTDSLFVEATT